MKTLFIVFATLLMAGCWLSAALDSFFPLAIPAFAVLVYVSIVDFKSIFFLLLACIPLSIEFQFPNGFSTDLPTEPLMIGLTFIYWLYSFKRGVVLSEGIIWQRGGKFFQHPITLLLLMHIGWAFITTVNSENFFFSFKYFLAKIWYVVTFYFLAALMLRGEKDYKRFFWCIATPLSIAVLITLFRHSLLNFSFEEVNRVMFPLFRNHVMYGCIVAIFLPFIVLGLSWQKRGSLQWWFLAFMVVMFFAAIQLSFTRAAYVAVIAAAAYFFILKYRLTKLLVSCAIIGIISFVTYLVTDNKYLDYAPKFERTITHTKFDNLLEATTKGEDISTMERVYRWVAGVRMVGDKPYMGFGPNNFFNFYKSYTVSSFKTYVSDNTDGSTVHCYYLLVAIEQGIPGFIIFLALIFCTLLKAEQVYYKSMPFNKGFLLATLMSFVIILMLNLINDIIETDKIGSFFFMSLAIITNLDINTTEEKL